MNRRRARWNWVNPKHRSSPLVTRLHPVGKLSFANRLRQFRFVSGIFIVSLPPANAVAKVMFSVMSVCHFVDRGGECPLYKALACPPPSMFNLHFTVEGIPAAPIPQDMFKHVHYEARTVCKRAFGILLDTVLFTLFLCIFLFFNGVLCGYFLPINVVIGILLRQVLLLLLLIIIVPGMSS